jgi:hypothetical protein
MDNRFDADRDDLNDRELNRQAAGKTNDPIHHDDHPDTGDVIGEAAGGISGVLTGAALGSLGGPIGTIIGGIAGAVGGWWTGRAISEAATRMTHDDDKFYQSHYETSSNRVADRSYEHVRPAYQLGHIASLNPDYAGRDFEAVESDLQRGWNDDVRNQHGDWQSVRGYARDAYQRGRSSTGMGAAGATATGTAAHGAGRTADNLDYAGDRLENTADRAGDKLENAGDRTGNALENAWDKTKQAAKDVGHSVERGVDNVKDRVDGDPASRPGTDPTDRRF